jgi:hypothetical protein
MVDVVTKSLWFSLDEAKIIEKLLSRDWCCICQTMKFCPTPPFQFWKVPWFIKGQKALLCHFLRVEDNYFLLIQEVVINYCGCARLHTVCQEQKNPPSLCPNEVHSQESRAGRSGSLSILVKPQSHAAGSWQVLGCWQECATGKLFKFAILWSLVLIELKEVVPVMSLPLGYVA